jgi:hypothetical protein
MQTEIIIYDGFDELDAIGPFDNRGDRAAFLAAFTSDA